MSPTSAPVLATDRNSLSTSTQATGTLTVIAGCMFSGKTTRLLQCLTQYPPEQVSALKHARDVRYGLHSIVSHAGAMHPCRMVCTAAEITPFVSAQTRCVAIDEGHFFADGLIEVVTRLRAGGFNCVVTALDRNSWGAPFPQVVTLMRMADCSVVCRARCGRCARAANRTQRLTPIDNGILVGGVGDYEPRCARCWHPPIEAPTDH